jgi:hypothetical protein
LDGLRRVACDGGVDSMLKFQLEMRGDGTKCYRKMKQRQRARLGSMASVAYLMLDPTCFVLGIPLDTFILPHVLVKYHLKAFVALL